MPLFLGIDIGTSATKAVVIDNHGALVASHSASHAISRPRDGWSEQDPDWWWLSMLESVRSVVRTAAEKRSGTGISAIGLSGQMHGSVFLSRESLVGNFDQISETARALRPALLWNDQRTAAECDEIESTVGGRDALVSLVGNAALTGFTLPKYLWLRKHEPRTADRVACVLMPKDYIRLRLTGRAATDVGDASGTLVFDVDRRRWSDTVMGKLGLNPTLWPAVFESGEIAGTLTSWAGRELGLAGGIPVIAGSGDNMCGAMGAGIAEPGLVCATLGTSGVIYAHTDSARKDRGDPGSALSGRTQAMCAATGMADSREGWCVTGCMLSAAGALHWARDSIAPGVEFPDLLSEAASAPPGCDGLTFLPYLTGERCPHADPRARAGWIGLTARHTRAHLLRAVIEGVSFGLSEILELVRGLGVPVREVRIGGGGAKSAFWKQMLADVFEQPVVLPNTEEGPAFGAALLAGVGFGAWPSAAAACRDSIRCGRPAMPNPETRYIEARARYRELYALLKPSWAAGHG